MLTETNEELTILNRSQLGLLSVKDLAEPTDGLTESERKEYVSQFSVLYPAIKKELENAVAQQIDFAIRSASSWEQVLIARGSINMGEILLERFRELNLEHMENIKPKEKFDPYQIIDN